MFPARWLLLVVSLAGVSCYKPSFGNMLRCYPAADGGANSCPAGFSCDTASGYCRRPDGGNVDRFAEAEVTEGGADMRDSGPCLDATVGGCEPTDAGICDPTCQTGCTGCRQKCSVNSLEQLTCNDVMASDNNFKQVMEFCTVYRFGLGTQTDDCAPGLTCLEDGCDWRCYKFCRTDSDCVNAACTREVVAGGQKVCDVPYNDACVPVGTTSGCSGPSVVACFLSAARPNHTVCDCPFRAMGPNGDCQRTRECNRGLACVDRGTGRPTCLQVCRLSNDGSDCPGMSSGSCHPYTGNPAGTISHPTFGYCF